MTDDEQPKRGRGRPRINPPGAVRRNVTVQVSLELYDELVGASEASGVSISREIEGRLAASLKQNATIKEAVSAALWDEGEKQTVEAGGRLGYSLAASFRRRIGPILTEAYTKFGITKAKDFSEDFINYVFERLTDTIPEIRKEWRGQIFMTMVVASWSDPEGMAAIEKMFAENPSLKQSLIDKFGK